MSEKHERAELVSTDTPLYRIAIWIAEDPAYAPARWCAEPYREALSTMESINDSYGLDSGSSIVAYLVSNLAQWRGPLARAVKSELRRRLKS
jgi:hypothetical protein